MIISSRNKYLKLNHPVIMGILNVTPDSFYDGGVFNKLTNRLDYVKNMIHNGASIIDIGGESTRPGATPVCLQQELDRVIPVIEEILNRFDVWVSVDTSKATIITEAAKAGVHMINDVRSLYTKDALQAAVNTKLPICIVHILNEIKIMQKARHYRNIIKVIKKYFLNQINRCKMAGITKNRLIIDPGFGFGKTLFHNYYLLSKLNELNIFGLPILVGISRKSMIGTLLNIPVNQRLIGSISCAVIAAMQGAKIIRVHDVKETFQAMKIIRTILSLNKSNYYE